MSMTSVSPLPILFTLALATIGCSRRPHEELGRASSIPAPLLTIQDAGARTAEAQEASPRTHPSAPPPPARVTPVTLLTLDASAYHSSISIDGDNAIYVLTARGAYRIVDGRKPQLFPLPLGFGAVLTQSSIRYWADGAVWSASKFDGKATRLGAVLHPPQYFVASRDYFAWVDRSDAGQFTIQTLDRRKPRVIYASGGMIDAMTMIDHWVFFVERVSDGQWRFGSIRLDGGEPAFTATKQGRSPAMLAATNDIYYYDGNSLEIRQLSPDLQHETTISRGHICSPIAVSEKIYCAQMGGLFELALANPIPRALIDGDQRSVTNVAANASLIAWLSDLGNDRLAVNLIERRELDRQR